MRGRVVCGASSFSVRRITGAPLGRAGHRFHRLFDVTPYTAPLARLGDVRSAGITDLRHGNLLDEDWTGRDRFAHHEDLRRQVPLPEDVDCFTIAATTARSSSDLRGRLLGDVLVPLASALGQHRDRARTLDLPESHRWIACGTSHLDLLARLDVYERLHDWLSN